MTEFGYNITAKELEAYHDEVLREIKGEANLLALQGVTVVHFVSSSNGRGRRPRAPRDVTLLSCDTGRGKRATTWKDVPNNRLDDVAKQAFGEMANDTTSPWELLSEAVEQKLVELKR